MNLHHAHLHCHRKGHYSCTKSDLLVYIMAAGTRCAISVDEDLFEPGYYDFIIIDGGVLIHSLNTTIQGKTFDSYFNQVFCPRVHHDLKLSTRVDIVWDQYRPLSRTGKTRNMHPAMRIWYCQNPMKLAEVSDELYNKKELFLFLSQNIIEGQFPDDKDV